MRRKKEDAMQTRETVLKASATVIAQQGTGAFTLDAVAREAGLTKGGVLHHFPSKEALINGLIDQVIAVFNSRLEEELLAEPPEAHGRWLRAYLRTVFSVHYDVNNLIPTLAAAVASDHHTLNRLRQLFAVSQQAAIDDGIDPVEATVVRLAIEGVVFTRALSVDVLDEAMSQNVFNKLFQLTTKNESP